MKLYIPDLKDKIRLTESLIVPLDDKDDYHLRWMAHRIMYGGAYDYKQAAEIVNFVLTKGTVLQFKRYFVSAHAQTNRVTVSIFAHPSRRLTPKKQGGTATVGEVTFNLPLDVLNQIEYEVDDELTG